MIKKIIFFLFFFFPPSLRDYNSAFSDSKNHVPNVKGIFSFNCYIYICIVCVCVCGVISLLPASAHGPSAIPMKQLGAGLQTGLLKLTTLKPFKMCFGEVWFGST